MAMQGGGGTGRPPGPEAWEVTDDGVPPMQANSEQVLAAILHGALGFGAKVRRVGEAGWGPLVARPEFGYAFPHMNFLNWKDAKKYNEASGVIALEPTLERATDIARKIASGPSSQKYAFWVSCVVDWIPAPIVRTRARMFKMWDGFWVAPIVESSTVRPGTWLNVYLVAFNLTNGAQARTLKATDAPIPEEGKAALNFNVPAMRWAVQRLSVPATQGPGAHKVGFTTRTGAERAATAVAVGVLTLGTFVHVPGSSGFSLTYHILPPQVANSVTGWESWGVEAADKRFAAARAVAIADATGRAIPKDAVLQRFRPYLTPTLILAALEDKEHGPEKAIASLFDDFLFDAFGVEGPEKAFVRPTGDTPTVVGLG